MENFTLVDNKNSRLCMRYASVSTRTQTMLRIPCCIVSVPVLATHCCTHTRYKCCASLPALSIKRGLTVASPIPNDAWSNNALHVFLLGTLHASCSGDRGRWVHFQIHPGNARNFPEERTRDALFKHDLRLWRARLSRVRTQRKVMGAYPVTPTMNRVSNSVLHDMPRQEQGHRSMKWCI